MTHRNRRVPPRKNPGEEQQAPPPAAPVAAVIPWKLLVITTGITTVTGYVILELVRGAHRSLARRREEKIASANPGLMAGQADAPQPVQPPGSLPNGNFQLPLPEGFDPMDVAGPGQVGFGQPRQLVDVNNPMGQLQHQLNQQAQATDARLLRIENLLSAHRAQTG